MTQTFVIDEGVLHLARAGTDSHGRRDLTAVAFLSAVEANRHTIGLTRRILQRYYGKLKSWERDKTVEGLNVNRVLTSVLSTEGRQVWIDTSGKHLPEGIPEDDADFVLAAWAKKGSLLVTQDAPLIESIETCSLKSRGVAAISVRDGLRAASEVDP